MTVSPAEPTHIGTYRVVERLGEGGMGVVHLALSPAGALVAVKTLRPWIIGGHDGRRRFEREVAALRRVHGPRIAAVIDADVVADPPYVVTRYVRGPAVSKVVGDHGPLRGTALQDLAAGLLEALASVHAAGLVHRDVKPGNVLLAEDGPVLIDFGLAHAVDETRLTAVGFVAGTPSYLAPETVLGQSITPATDLHGWAATIAYAATGRAPYGSGPDSVVLDRIRRGDHDVTGVDEPLRSLVVAALATDAAARPQLATLTAALGIEVSPGPVEALAVDDDPDDAATVIVEEKVDTDAVGPDAVDTQVVDADAVRSQIDDPDSVDTQIVDADSVQTQVTAPEAAATVVLRPTSPPTRLDAVVPPPPSPPPISSPVPSHAPPSPPRAPHRVPPSTQQLLTEGQPLHTWPARIAVALGAVALLTLLGLVPYVGAVVLLLLLIGGRVVWRVRRRLYERRVARGALRNDHLKAALGAPVDAAAAFFPALGQALLVLGCGYLVGAAVDLAGLGEVLLGDRIGYVIGAALALVLAWWGPGSGRFRHGVRVVAGPLERNPRAAWIVAGVLAVVAWTFALLGEGFGTSWWPGTGPPNPFG